MREMIKTDRIGNLLLFMYAWFTCFNQYFKLFGVPLFIYVLAVLIIYDICKNNFKIRIGSKNKATPVFTGVIWLLYGLVYAVIVNNGPGWRYLLFASLNLFGYLIVMFYCSDSPSARTAVAKGLIVGLLTNLLVSTWEITTGGHIVPLTSEYQLRFANMPLGFFANTNDLSVVILTILVALTVWLTQRKRGKLQILFFGAMALYALYILIISNSTTCIILMPFMVLLTLLLYKNKNGGSMCLLMTIFIVFAMMLFVFFGGVDIIVGRYFSDVDFTSVSGRKEIWAEALKAFWQSNLLGIGPGQNSVKTLGMAHNIAIELLSEYGIFIFIMIVCSYLNIIKYQINKSRNVSNSIGSVFTLVIIPLSVASSSITKLFPFWIAFALIISCDEEEIFNDTYGRSNIPLKREFV